MTLDQLVEYSATLFLTIIEYRYQFAVSVKQFQGKPFWNQSLFLRPKNIVLVSHIAVVKSTYPSACICMWDAGPHGFTEFK